MKAEFFIDRQFGQAIFVDVEDGIVTKIYNDSKMEKKMTELYVGKSISFLKEDFENKMKGIYHCVKSYDWANAIQRVEGAKSQLLFAERRIWQSDRKLKDATTEEKQTLESLQIGIYEAEKKVIEIKKVLKDTHQFEF